MSVPSFFEVSLRRFGVLLAAYSVSRTIFLVWNWPLFSHDSPLELLQAHLHGLRFDVSAILLTNFVSFLIWMLPWRWLSQPVVAGIDLALVAIVNLLCLGANFVDSEYVQFIGRRSAYDMVYALPDLLRVSASVISTYWILALSLGAVLTLLVWFYPRQPLHPPPRESWIKGLGWRIFALLLIAFGQRGSLEAKPIKPINAYFSTKQELGLLALNTPLNMIKTLPTEYIERTTYFKTDREAIVRLKAMTDLSRPPLAVAKDWNVVILILESFSLEYTGIGNPYPGYTPFLNSLAQKSLTFKLNFANGRRSIEGVPAILCGIPAMMKEPVIASYFSGNRFDCLPKLLSTHGYSTYFLHGAYNGSMHFDAFSRLAGFQNFIGFNEYPNPSAEDIDPAWGIQDEPMLQYAVKVMDAAPKPALLSLFTLSSHHPYTLPSKYRGQFPKGTLEIHESIGYADHALAEYFAAAATKPWFNKTIFVLTGDHTQKSDRKQYSDLIGAFRVPLLIYAPGLETGSKVFKASPRRITQHIDIVPSVLDLLGISVPDRLLIGQSVFDQSKPGRAFNYTSYGYWYIEPHIFVDYGRPPWRPLLTYSHNDTYDIKPQDKHASEFAEPLENLKAAIHYMNQGLAHNSLYTWRRSL